MEFLKRIKSFVVNINFLVYLATVLISGLIVIFNYDAFNIYRQSNGFSSGNLYKFVFVNLVLSSVFLLKLSMTRVLNDESTAMLDFFELNNERKKITFGVFVNFLSEQALGAFLATVIVITGKGVMTDYGVVLAAIYTFLMYVLAITVMTISFVKLISHFVKRRKREYILVSISSGFVLFSFFRLGLSMA
ncbi:hypothetical protein [Vibrio hangzhouensis]|uniref:hypothetical protein n=1 Tax=Vibrio hangzhouensis TaxID=462991 RepID=UPI001C939589|nr:hypothetical protein [Vibrio hangzhouensis]MBY6199719.1 hypothetical protein [Vibrio hangzhouensis]